MKHFLEKFQVSQICQFLFKKNKLKLVLIALETVQLIPRDRLHVETKKSDEISVNFAHHFNSNWFHNEKSLARFEIGQISPEIALRFESDARLG